MKIIKSYYDFINESRSAYDGLASKLVKTIFTRWIKDWNSGKKSSTFYEQVEGILEFDIDATITFSGKGFEVHDSTGADARDIDDDGDDQTPFITIYFRAGSDFLPQYWQEIYMHLSDVIRHEIEHITQDGKGVGNYKAGKPVDDDSEMRALIKANIIGRENYLMLPKEIDANLQGLRYEAKKRKEAMIDTVNRYLDTQTYLTADTRQQVLDIWRQRAKKIGGIPNF